MVSVDGALKHMPPYLVGELQLRGWRRIDNPKRTYYPEYDQTLPSYKPEEKKGTEIDALPIEIL